MATFKFIGGPADGEERECTHDRVQIPFRCGGGFCTCLYERCGDTMKHVRDDHRDEEQEDILMCDNWRDLVCRQFAASEKGKKWMDELEMARP